MIREEAHTEVNSCHGLRYSLENQKARKTVTLSQVSVLYHAKLHTDQTALISLKAIFY